MEFHQTKYALVVDFIMVLMMMIIQVRMIIGGHNGKVVITNGFLKVEDHLIIGITFNK